MSKKDKSKTTEYNREYAKKRYEKLKSAGYKVFSVRLSPDHQKTIDRLRGSMSLSACIVKIIEVLQQSEEEEQFKKIFNDMKRPDNQT